MTDIKPMLAVAMDQPENLTYPAYVSAKLDGIRCLIHPELGPVSRKLKPIPNDYIRKYLDCSALHGLDGELLAVHPDTGAPLTFNECQSAIMSQDGYPRFKFMVFDDFTHPELPFSQRVLRAREKALMFPNATVEWHEHHKVRTPEELRQWAQLWVSQGYEGLMYRRLEGPYKFGRSTLSQQWLLKWKPWSDAEGVVVRVEELMINENEQVRDELGHSKRSTAASGLRPGGTLGALVLHTEWGEVSVGSGFDDRTRDRIWSAGLDVVGRTVTFKYQTPPRGVDQDIKPRFPIFKGFRHEDDLG